jgi:NADH dehydrogenase
VYAFEQMVRLLAQAVGGKARVARLPPGLVLASSRLMGLLVRDVVLTRDELAGLMAGLLVSQQPPRGETSFQHWLERQGSRLGLRYTSELRRHFR